MRWKNYTDVKNKWSKPINEEVSQRAINVKTVGYLTNYSNRLDGEKGLFYDYIMAANGIWIEASGVWLTARVQVADGNIRGLAPLEQSVTLRFGKIPARLFDLALNEMLKDPTRELYVAITHNGDYHLVRPEQIDTQNHVQYNNPDSVVVDLHSHGTMGAGFSSEDNRDDQGLRISIVVGMLNRDPVLVMRVGVYGYHRYVAWDDVFEGTLPIIEASEFAGDMQRIIIRKEVPLIDLQNQRIEGQRMSEFFHSRINW